MPNSQARESKALQHFAKTDETLNKSIIKVQREVISRNKKFNLLAT
jgi:hypothetical protein